jgi:probable F420-dependent oxidoreductase
MTTFGVSVRQDIATSADGTFDAQRWSDVFVRAEQLGYQQAFVADHIFVPQYMARVIGDVWLDPFTLLAFLAARTSQIELVISCLVVPYRQPFATAKAIATLDQLSAGRCALGVVPGYIREEFDTFRLPLAQRSDMTNEFIQIMIQAWVSESATYEGTFYSCQDIDVKPKCVRRPHVPIWVGGSSNSALRRVARFGDVWHPMGFTVISEQYKQRHGEALQGRTLPTSGTTPRKLREGIEQIQALASEAGRDLSDLEVVVLPGLPDAEGRGDRPFAKRAGVSQDEVVDWLGQYVEAGATGFYVSPTGSSLEECQEHLERYAAEVIPQFT